MVASLVRVILRVVEDDVRRKTFDNPLMLESFVRGHSLFWIPFKASADEVDEGLVRHFS